MSDFRKKNRDWKLRGDGSGSDSLPIDEVQVAVLMDIRDELKELNAFFRNAAEQAKKARDGK